MEKNQNKIFFKKLCVFLIYGIPSAIVFIGVYFLARTVIRKMDKNNKLSNKQRVLIQILAAAVNAILLLIIMKMTMHNGIQKLAYSFVY